MKQLLANRFGNAGAIVRHRDCDRTVRALDLDLNFSPYAGRRLASIEEKIV
jgi:hypothetical protein